MEKWIEEKVTLEKVQDLTLAWTKGDIDSKDILEMCRQSLQEAYEKGVKERYVYNARRSGKQLLQMGDFIQAVRMGKKPLIIGLDYVVMSKEMFNKLNQEQGGTIIE